MPGWMTYPLQSTMQFLVNKTLIGFLRLSVKRLLVLPPGIEEWEQYHNGGDTKEIAS